MKKQISKLIISIIVLCFSVLFAGCSKKENECLTVDYYAERANYQGVQGGWYGKILNDKFNMKLNIIAPNVAGGGEMLFKSRLSSGNVGDIVLTSMKNQKECIDNGLLIDLTKYLENTKYLKNYMNEIRTMNQHLNSNGKIYVIPVRMSTSSPSKPNLYGDKPVVASYMPWDYYVELGCPKIKNDEELLDVLEKMQKKHPYTKNGEKVYAFSLFKDWDNEYMSLAARIAQVHGISTDTDSIFLNMDTNEPEQLVADGGAYFNALKLYYHANQRGLLDPESGVQSYEEMAKKVESKQVLYLWYAWMVGYYNELNSNQGYAYIPVEDQVIVSEGYNPYGVGYAVSIEKNAKDIERIIKYLDWSVSPEGMMYYIAGIEG